MIGEIIGLIIAIILVVVLFKVLKSIPALVVNAIVGVVILWLLNLVLGQNIVINIWSILISAIGGIAGVIIVVVLHFLGIAF
jgi:hypothetical protein